MPLFLLIRHGENNYVKKNRLAGRLPGIHLNRKGRTQAKALAEALAVRMAEHPPKAVYSSPMERALETAEPIAKAFQLEIIQRPGLLETDCGEWTDQTIRSLRRQKLWRIVQGAPSRFSFPGGESFPDIQNRIRAEIETLASMHEPKDVIICVSHADPIKMAIAYFLGLPLDMFQRISVSPASISAMYVGEGGSQLINLNYDLSFSIPKA